MNSKSITAEELAKLTNGKLIGDNSRVATGIASLKDAQCGDISFVGNKKYFHQLDESKAGIVLVSEDFPTEENSNRTIIICENVDYAFAQAANIFAIKPPEAIRTIHPRAVVDETAVIGKNVSIGANAVIEANATIGDNAVISANCYVGHDAKIGADTLLYPNVTVMYRCEIGCKTIIHSGVVIGGDGFGFTPTKTGLVKVPQSGIVRIGNDVEIGANTTVDRARFGVTWIKDNVKIDNQVMIAHNVVVGESSILIAQSGIAGSAEIGRGVIVAAKAGINGHISLGDGVKVAGTSGVVKSVPAGEIVVGTPAESQREFLARLSLPKKIEKLSAKIEALKAEIAELKKH